MFDLLIKSLGICFICSVHLDVRNVVPIFFLTSVLVCIVMRMWGKEVVSCHGDKLLPAQYR